MADDLRATGTTTRPPRNTTSKVARHCTWYLRCVAGCKQTMLPHRPIGPMRLPTCALCFAARALLSQRHKPSTGDPQAFTKKLKRLFAVNHTRVTMRTHYTE